jgi:vacuolar protein 8
MGGVCSSCCKLPVSCCAAVLLVRCVDDAKGGQRRKNSYEPLLLENEREAVADLLQYLESASLSHPGIPFLMYVR